MTDKAPQDEFCQYCSHAEASVVHDSACPRVAAVEYFDDGVGQPLRIRRIEFNSLPDDFFR